MTALDKLKKAQAKNNSMICLGLDLDPKKMPAEFSKSSKAMFDFAMRMIDATADAVCAYKPNMAFYESLGGEGFSLLKVIIERIPSHIPVILDAKRGDIGNTAAHYAQALFEKLDADWVTLNPYMGYDSLRPFLEYKEKGSFILCLTSNPGSKDFQTKMVDGKPLYQVVAESVNYWNKAHNCGLVVGATAPEQLSEIRGWAGEMPLLIPGVGAQGGSLELAVTNGTDSFRKPALINVSRSVLYASKGEDFADKARAELNRLNSVVRALRQGQQVTQATTGEQPAEADSVEAGQKQPPQVSEQPPQQQPEQQEQHRPEPDRQAQAEEAQPEPAQQALPESQEQTQPEQPLQAQPEQQEQHRPEPDRQAQTQQAQPEPPQQAPPESQEQTQPERSQQAQPEQPEQTRPEESQPQNRQPIPPPPLPPRPAVSEAPAADQPQHGEQPNRQEPETIERPPSESPERQEREEQAQPEDQQPTETQPDESPKPRPPLPPPPPLPPRPKEDGSDTVDRVGSDRTDSQSSSNNSRE